MEVALASVALVALEDQVLASVGAAQVALGEDLEVVVGVEEEVVMGLSLSHYL